MKLLLCSAVLLFIAVPLSKAETVEEMLSACRQTAEARVAEGKVFVEDTRESGLCWGAFAVIQRLINLVYVGDENPILGVCAPAESKRTQLIAIFVLYAKNHPERYAEDFTDVALVALREAFPCKVQKK
jgi:Rap1a immunity proteins